MKTITDLEKLNAVNKNTLMETLDITYTEIGEDYLVATMPVNSKVHQPMGLLHGGATVAVQHLIIFGLRIIKKFVALK